jgi:uncharacterized protein
MENHTASRYTISIPLKNDRALVYNSLSGGMALLEARDRDVYEKIRAGEVSADQPAEITRSLEQGGFIVRTDIDELMVPEQQYQAHRYNQSLMMLTIAPTLACNFGCDYCFQGQDKPTQTMGQDVQDAIVDLVIKAAPNLKTVGVAWYGGEPLLRLKVIEALSDRMLSVCEERGLKYEASIVTNGYLLDGKAARSLWDRRCKVAQVTLDGAPDHHDARRYLLSGKGTFERIARNLRDVVDSSELQLSIRVNIDERNGDEIKDLIDHLAAAGLGGRKTLKMYFAPVEAITEGCHSVEDVCFTKSKYGELEAALYRHAFEAGLAALPYPPRFHGTCAAVRPKGFVIVPTGDVHKCWDTVNWPDRAVGTIFDIPGLVKSELAMRWLKWTPFVNETCKNCKLLPNCAGACAYKFVHTGIQRGEAAVLPCPSWKYNIKERLVLRAVGMNIITRDDYDPAEIKTVPTELCADVHLDGGQALPEEMQLFYEAEKKKKLPLLPVATQLPAAAAATAAP